jgi:hypothetical protein
MGFLRIAMSLRFRDVSWIRSLALGLARYVGDTSPIASSSVLFKEPNLILEPGDARHDTRIAVRRECFEGKEIRLLTLLGRRHVDAFAERSAGTLWRSRLHR